MEKNKVISNLIWKFMERIGAQVVSLIVSIVLARLIAPEEYGLIALTTIFITISNVFVESGMPTALIQKKDADHLDFSTVFYFNIFMSIIMYGIIYIISPYIALFYNQSKLVNVLRILGIVIIIAGLKSVQNAYVSRKMIFKKFFICTLIATLISAIIGIVMAYKGFGVWALVAQQLSNTLIGTSMLWIFVDWRPKLEFSFLRLKELFSFGWKLLCSSLLDTVYNQLYGLTIGKVYSTEMIAYYNKGNQFPSLITTNINGSISSVMLPTLSKEQDKKENIKKIMRRSIKTSSFILFPILMGLAAVAEPVIKIVLTEKWLECVPFLQLLCFSYILWPIHTINLEAIKALGKSNIFLKLELIKKIIGVIVLLISIPLGIYYMVGLQILTSIIGAFINAYPNKKLLNYTMKEQIKDIMPSFIISLIMFIAVLCCGILKLNIYLKLLLQVSIGIIIYILLVKIFKLEIYDYLKETIKNFFIKK